MVSEKVKPLINSNSAIRAMFEEGKRLAAIHGAENVYDFSLSNPSAPTPAEVNLAICDILKEGESIFVHDYMSNAGCEGIRQAVVKSLNERFGIWFHRSSILMTVGVTSGLNVILRTLPDPGDEAITFTPYLVEYDNYVRNYDENLVVISPDITDFEPNLTELEQRISARTKAVIINTPNSPTGMMYSLETLTKIANIIRAKEKELRTTAVLLSDGPYRELACDGVGVPYVTNVYDSTVIRYSYNKSLSLPGERVGYLMIPDALKDSGGVFSTATVTGRALGCVSAPSLMQRVIMHCLDARVNLETYDRGRSLLYSGLKDLGFEYIKSRDAFYLFVKPPKADEKKFCKNCEKYNVLMVPGTFFTCPGYVRIPYCVSYEQVEHSLPAFAKTTVDYDLKK